MYVSGIYLNIIRRILFSDELVSLESYRTCLKIKLGRRNFGDVNLSKLYEIK